MKTYPKADPDAGIYYSRAKGRMILYKEMPLEDQLRYDEETYKKLHERHFSRDKAVGGFADLLRRLAGFVREMNGHYMEMLDDGVFSNPADTPFHKNNAIPAAFHKIADMADGVIGCFRTSHAGDIAQFGETDAAAIMSGGSDELRRAADFLPRQNGFLNFAPPKTPAKKTRQNKPPSKKLDSVLEYAHLVRRLADFLPEINDGYRSLHARGIFNECESRPKPYARVPRITGEIPDYLKPYARPPQEPVVFLNIAAAFTQIGEANKQIIADARRNRPQTDAAATLEEFNNMFLKEAKYLLYLNSRLRAKHEKEEEEAAAAKNGCG